MPPSLVASVLRGAGGTPAGMSAVVGRCDECVAIDPFTKTSHGYVDGMVSS